VIKALYLESYPNMDKVSSIDVLNELNPLTKNDYKSLTLVDSGDNKIYKDEFITFNYIITFLKIEDTLTFISIKKIYEIIQLSVPNFIKVINVNHTLILVIPRYNDASENAGYSDMMEELVRFTSYAYRKTNGDDLNTSIMLKEYVEMCVSFPGNRLKSYKSDERK
jgi:hypothetical protein